MAPSGDSCAKCRGPMAHHRWGINVGRVDSAIVGGDKWGIPGGRWLTSGGESLSEDVDAALAFWNVAKHGAYTVTATGSIWP